MHLQNRNPNVFRDGNHSKMSALHSILVFGCLHIRWRLLDMCVRECSWCPEPAGGNDCVYMRERLLTMVDKILALPRPFYSITFTGGEPCLHPFLPDVIRKLLHSGRKVGITLETTGGAGPEYYDSLLKGLPRGSLRLSLASHPEWDNMGGIAANVASALRQGQLAHLRLMHDPAAGCSMLAAAAAIAEKFPAVSSEIWSVPGFRQLSRLTNPVNLAASPEMYGSFQFERQLANMPGPEMGVWCCQGVNLLAIEPDGHFYGASCPMACSPLPLWQRGVELSPGRIFHCAHQACPGGVNNILPKFASENEARDFMSQYERQRKIWAFNAPLLRLAKKATPEDIVRARLRRLPIGKITDFAEADLAAIRLGEVTKIFSALADEASRDAFLACVKALESGSELLASEGSAPEQSDRNRFAGELSGAELPELAQKLAYLPDLDVSLKLDLDFIDGLLWLTASYPAYRFWMYVKDGKPHICARAAIPHIAAPKPADGEKPLVSILIACHNAQEQISQSLYSCLAQELPEIEVIAVDDASGDATWSIISQVKAIAKDKIRPIRLKEPVGQSASLELALSHAAGQYLLFLEPGAVLSASFMADQKYSLVAAEAQVIAGETVLLSNDGEEITCLAGSDLPDFLAAWSRGFSLSACLIQDAFARKLGICPAAISGEPDLQLAAQIFSVNAELKLCDQVAVSRQLLPARSEQAAHMLAASLQTIANLAQTYRLETELIRACESWLYRRCLMAAFNDLNESRTSRREDYGAHREFMARLLIDASAQFCRQKRLAPKIKEADLDWRKAAANLATEPDLVAHINADNPDTETPVLSIVFYNHNGMATLERSLEAIANQNMRDYELFIVDDASDDGSWAFLQDQADFDPSIRLYRSQSFTGPGPLYAMAFKRARGAFLLFMDAADLLEPDYLPEAIERSLQTGADLNIYTMQHILPEGSPAWRQFILDGKKTQAEVWHLYQMGEICAQNAAIIYRTGFCRAADCEFGLLPYRSQDFFLTKAVKSAKRMYTNNRIAVRRIVEQEYNLLPVEISYRQIKAVLNLQDFLIRQNAGPAYGQLSPAFVEFKNRLFAPLHAFYSETGELPLTEADYGMLAANKDFSFSLCEDFARENEWEFSRPVEPANPQAIEARKPAVEVIWKGEIEDWPRSKEMFATQTLRDWNLDLPTGLSEPDPRFNGNETAEFVCFTDYGCYLEPNDLLRAAAILRQNPDVDFVCYIEPSPYRKEPMPGGYNGDELLELHLDEQTAPIHWQACVFRKSFLDGLEFGEMPAGGEILLLEALAKTGKALLIIPEKGHAHRLRFRPGPDAAARFRKIASEIAAYFRKNLPGRDCKPLLLKFMDECNLKPMVGQELKDLMAEQS